MRHPGTSLPRLRCRARPVNKKADWCQRPGARWILQNSPPVPFVDHKPPPHHTATSVRAIARLGASSKSEIRVFYDVTGTAVEVLAIVAKSEAQSWLAQFGSPR
jgi:hypothetical protein